jgi:peptide/nickel transport system ATP-binding protein
VDGVSFSVAQGRTFGILGESGCGKSVTALSLLRLVAPPGRIVSGEIRYRGEDLLRRSERQMREIRGGEIAMIFQEPMTSLNPVFTIGNQIGEAVQLHQHLDGAARRERVVEALRKVEIPEPERRARSYPHELSGGMRQRAMIAMALACEPSLLIADEPTTALDVTIQAQILDLLRGLRDSLGMAMILITHDLGIVAEQADEVAVMYAGRIVERASVFDTFERPLHPYTVALMHAAGQRHGTRQHRLEALPGTVPNLFQRPSGCRFRDRCTRAIAACADVDPVLEEKAASHGVACIRV